MHADDEVPSCPEADRFAALLSRRLARLSARVSETRWLAPNEHSPVGAYIVVLDLLPAHRGIVDPQKDPFVSESRVLDDVAAAIRQPGDDLLSGLWWDDLQVVAEASGPDTALHRMLDSDRIGEAVEAIRAIPPFHGHLLPHPTTVVGLRDRLFTVRERLGA